jgi:hypothetical protein
MFLLYLFPRKRFLVCQLNTHFYLLFLILFHHLDMQVERQQVLYLIQVMVLPMQYRFMKVIELK